MEESPAGDPCGKVTPETAESFLVTAEADRCLQGAVCLGAGIPCLCPWNRVPSKAVETNTRASLTGSQGSLGVCDENPLSTALRKASD